MACGGPVGAKVTEAGPLERRTSCVALISLAAHSAPVSSPRLIATTDETRSRSPGQSFDSSSGELGPTGAEHA